MIVVDIGVGHTHTFLNGIRIYTTLGEKKQIAGKEYNVCYYSKSTEKAECCRIIREKVKAEEDGYDLNPEDIEKYALQLVEEAYNTNQIEVIKRKIMDNLLT